MRDLIVILFFYEKNQCQSTDPLRNQAGQARPAAPLPNSEPQWQGAALFQVTWVLFQHHYLLVTSDKYSISLGLSSLIYKNDPKNV